MTLKVYRPIHIQFQDEYQQKKLTLKLHAIHAKKIDKAMFSLLSTRKKTIKYSTMEIHFKQALIRCFTFIRHSQEYTETFGIFNLIVTNKTHR